MSNQPDTQQHPIKLGLIGTGVAARELHWPALQRAHDAVELVAVCNRSAEKAQAFAEMAGGVAWYTDWDAFLAHPGLEAVDIVLPVTENVRATQAALMAGKHVLVEKPLAATPEEARWMLALAGKHPGQVTMVAENLRYSAAMLHIKAWLASGAAGRTYALHWRLAAHMQPDNRFIASGWRTNDAFPGGLLLDAGVHYTAAAQMLLGDITSARILPSQSTNHLGRWDGASLQFDTASGAHGTMNLYFAAAGLTDFKLEVLAEYGTATFDGRHVVLYGADGSRIEADFADDDFGYAAELRDFAAAIRTGRPVASTVEQAWHDMQVWSATLARPGEVIHF
ncbi:Gfo/Idh/MocA family protein [Andreprevotia chitinilytica]|uniref:Gfo/Idh/MocA family protein n=1 Tax=Andreprevotia chitinilytica TaxID=396808 RepID=UPI000553CD76|nr:Gfo/Idh/MocA family oxidoreductase [Andreprevotia chitinilytica]